MLSAISSVFSEKREKIICKIVVIDKIKYDKNSGYFKRLYIWIN
jgi:hypothetical protein